MNCRKRQRGVREQGGTSCKPFWSNLKGKKKRRKIERMKAKGGRVVKGEDGFWRK